MTCAVWGYSEGHVGGVGWEDDGSDAVEGEYVCARLESFDGAIGIFDNPRFYKGRGYVFSMLLANK